MYFDKDWSKRVVKEILFIHYFESVLLSTMSILCNIYSLNMFFFLLLLFIKNLCSEMRDRISRQASSRQTTLH